MSGDPGGAEGPNKLPVAYAVGYRKPPVESRFRKGQSGNPKGRPKGARARPKVEFDPAQPPTDRLILEEAYRPVTIREGDKDIELLAIQAAVRALAISAIKGNRLSQKALAEITQTVEAREAEERLTLMENALEYKLKWTAEIERCRRQGVDEPPLPRPADVVIDMRTARVRTEGPVDEQEKQRWDQRLARRDDAQAEVTFNAVAYKRARSESMREMHLREWISEHYI